ncbi:Unconventional myosin-IXb [Balamuthia mandrillaris]
MSNGVVIGGTLGGSATSKGETAALKWAHQLAWAGYTREVIKILKERPGLVNERCADNVLEELLLEGGGATSSSSSIPSLAVSQTGSAASISTSSTLSPRGLTSSSFSLEETQTAESTTTSSHSPPTEEREKGHNPSSSSSSSSSDPMAGGEEKMKKKEKKTKDLVEAVREFAQRHCQPKPTTPSPLSSSYANVTQASSTTTTSSSSPSPAANETTLLHVAVRTGNLTLVKELLKKYNANPNVHDSLHHCLPLHYACDASSLHHHKRMELIEYLASHNSNLNAKCKDVAPPVLLLEENDNENEEEEDDYNGNNSNSSTYEKEKKKKKRKKETIKPRHQHNKAGKRTNEQLNLKHYHGCSSFHLLVCHPPQLQWSADAALYWDKYSDAVEWMILCGANIDTQSDDGNTPLMDAVLQENRQLVQLLLRNGANPDVGNTYGNTSLHLAVKGGKTDIITSLLEYGASTEQKNGESKNAKELAESMGRHDISVLLANSVSLQAKFKAQKPNTAELPKRLHKHQRQKLHKLHKLQKGQTLPPGAITSLKNEASSTANLSTSPLMSPDGTEDSSFIPSVVESSGSLRSRLKRKVLKGSGSSGLYGSSWRKGGLAGSSSTESSSGGIGGGGSSGTGSSETSGSGASSTGSYSFISVLSPRKDGPTLDPLPRQASARQLVAGKKGWLKWKEIGAANTSSKSWRKFYCVLSNVTLYFYKSPQATNPCHEINLEDVVEITADQQEISLTSSSSPVGSHIFPEDKDGLKTSGSSITGQRFLDLSEIASDKAKDGTLHTFTIVPRSTEKPSEPWPSGNTTTTTSQRGSSEPAPVSFNHSLDGKKDGTSSGANSEGGGSVLIRSGSMPSPTTSRKLSPYPPPVRVPTATPIFNEANSANDSNNHLNCDKPKKEPIKLAATTYEDKLVWVSALTTAMKIAQSSVQLSINWPEEKRANATMAVKALVDYLSKGDGTDRDAFLKLRDLFVRQGSLEQQKALRLYYNTRKPGHKFKILYKTDEPVVDDDDTYRTKDAYAVAKFLLALLKEHPVPILTYKLVSSFFTISKLLDPAQQVVRYRALVAELPQDHYQRLHALLPFLKRLADLQTTNGLTYETIIDSFGTCIIRRRTAKSTWEAKRDNTLIYDLVTFLIKHHSRVLLNDAAEDMFIATLEDRFAEFQRKISMDGLLLLLEEEVNALEQRWTTIEQEEKQEQQRNQKFTYQKASPNWSVESVGQELKALRKAIQEEDEAVLAMKKKIEVQLEDSKAIIDKIEPSWDFV